MVRAPIQASFLTPANTVSSIWALFFTAIADKVSSGVPVALPVSTVAAVPTAANYTGTVIYISNESGGATIAFSDGTNWRRVQDRAVIS